MIIVLKKDETSGVTQASETEGRDAAGPWTSKSYGLRAKFRLSLSSPVSVIVESQEDQSLASIRKRDYDRPSATLVVAEKAAG